MKVVLVKTKKSLRLLCESLACAKLCSDPVDRAFAIDTETYVPGGAKKSFKKEGLVLDRARIMYISISRGDVGWGIPLSSFDNRCLPTAYVLKKLEPFLADKDLIKVMHHANYDINMFKNHGVKFNLSSVYCTMIAGHCWEENYPDSLKERCILVGMRLRPTKTVDMSNLKELTEYAVDDAIATWKLYEGYEKGKIVVVRGKKRNMKLKASRRKFFKMEMDALAGVVRMERRGMKVDLKKLNEIDRKIRKKIDFFSGKLYVKNGKPFNVKSRPQLCEFLFKKLKLPIQNLTPKGAPSTDKSALANLSRRNVYVRYLVKHNSMQSLLHYVSPDKGLQLYVDDNDRIHSTFSQVRARTARASSSNPNLQQIPSKTDVMGIRKAFIAPPGKQLIVADMDQLELRLMAIHSRDPMMLNAYRKGVSIHMQTGLKTGLLPPGTTKDAIKGDMKLERAYNISKSCNFLLMYEGSHWMLMNQLILEGIDISEDEARGIVEKYWDVYSGVPMHRHSLYKEHREVGFIRNICGRPFRIMDMDSSNYRWKKAAERQCINTEIQSGGADWLKFAMIRIDADQELKDYKYQMLFAVHDEIIGEVPEKWAKKAAARKKKLMETAPPNLLEKLVVPLTASAGIGDNWSAAK